MQNTLYIAEPIFSEMLQKFDGEASFPPIKKIGITHDAPNKREKELLGTKSPIKVSIIKAWTNLDARQIERMLHNILDNTRLDGEYFWDGNETLVDSVSDFILTYHPDAQEIGVSDDPDVKAATETLEKKNSDRMLTEVVPTLDELGIDHTISQNGQKVHFHLGDYKLVLSGRTAGRFTLTIWSKTKTTEEALSDFEHSQELSANSTEDSSRKARIPMSKLSVIFESIREYVEKNSL
ncbi:GIY-YIG nuclease family protein [Kangiella sp.]|uniref:GIY-YIG nuclease family protein n=1 Tax=Kangiella sp. TaxID=1920245 RepID=UPI0019BBCD5F|nr:GIY-YIG nuclease family protein [Kangiella sp.]MBD3653128.1 GIY-YIG nuclease family protein [Kangiella sp.]